MLTSKYCVDSNFLDCKVPSVASHGWRSILRGCDLIKRKARYSVGNGRRIRIWRDKWLPSTQHHQPVGPCQEHNENFLVKELISEQNKDWDRAKTDELLPDFRDSVLNIKLSKEGVYDRQFWTPTRDGEYTTKSGYFELTAMEQSHDTQPVHFEPLNWNSTIWNLRCPPKVQLFIWKIFHDAVPAGATLVSQGLNVSSICHHCGQTEDTNHVLFSCPFALEVWKLVGWKSELNFPLGNDTLASVNKTHYHRIVFPTVPLLLGCYGAYGSEEIKICFRRNQNLKAIVDARDWQLAQIKQVKSTVPTGLTRAATSLHVPLASPDSMYTDASWSEVHKTAALGLVLTNSDTNRTFQFAVIEEFVYSPLMGEALAIRAAILKAISMNLHRLQLYSDSKTCVDLIHSKENHPELYDILHDIRLFSLSFESFAISFIPRLQNVSADVVAHRALSDFIFAQELNVVTENV